MWAFCFVSLSTPTPDTVLLLQAVSPLLGILLPSKCWDYKHHAHVRTNTHTYPRTTAKPNQNENLVLKNCSQGLEKDLEKEPELGNGVCSVLALARKGFASTVDCFEVKQPDLPLKQLLEVAFSGADAVRWLKTPE